MCLRNRLDNDEVEKDIMYELDTDKESQEVPQVETITCGYEIRVGVAGKEKADCNDQDI